MNNLSYNIFSLLDLTSLNPTDDPTSIITLCQKALRPSAHVAAICVYPQFVGQAAKALVNTPVKIAAVANFPQGTEPVATVIASIQEAIYSGAQEMDVVLPYLSYLAGDRKYAHEFVSACREACGSSVLLKVILETGALRDKKIIAAASEDVLLAGADFIKTSTGKIALGATLEAAETMLLIIKDLSTKLSRSFGLKISGGIRTEQIALQYILLAEKIMGADWINPQHFRIGASQLVDTI